MRRGLLRFTSVSFPVQVPPFLSAGVALEQMWKSPWDQEAGQGQGPALPALGRTPLFLGGDWPSSTQVCFSNVDSLLVLLQQVAGELREEYLTDIVPKPLCGGHIWEANVKIKTSKLFSLL